MWTDRQTAFQLYIVDYIHICICIYCTHICLHETYCDVRCILSTKNFKIGLLFHCSHKDQFNMNQITCKVTWLLCVTMCQRRGCDKKNPGNIIIGMKQYSQSIGRDRCIYNNIIMCNSLWLRLWTLIKGNYMSRIKAGLGTD